jgi:hypothetical protein
LWPDSIDVTDVEDFAKLLSQGRLDKYLLVWRGVSDVAWPIDSSLFRRLTANRKTGLVDEAAMLSAEQALLEDARRYRFDRRDGFELTDLELLAVLQHHGAGTRLVDVSLNAMVGLWFAVEDSESDHIDGAVFAIDVTDRRLPVSKHGDRIGDLVTKDALWVWRPPPMEERIKAQQGAFIFSAVPVTVSGQTSLNLELKKYDPGRLFAASPKAGRYPKRPVVVFRIPAASKGNIRNFLKTYLGLTRETMFPDLPGFAQSRGA